MNRNLVDTFHIPSDLAALCVIFILRILKYIVLTCLYVKSFIQFLCKLVSFKNADIVLHDRENILQWNAIKINLKCDFDTRLLKFGCTYLFAWKDLICNIVCCMLTSFVCHDKHSCAGSRSLRVEHLQADEILCIRVEILYCVALDFVITYVYFFCVCCAFISRSVWYPITQKFTMNCIGMGWSPADVQSCWWYIVGSCDRWFTRRYLT